jgi:hypothetical protein
VGEEEEEEEDDDDPFRSYKPKKGGNIFTH